LKWNSAGRQQALTLFILNFKYEARLLDASTVQPMIEAHPVAQCVAPVPARQRYKSVAAGPNAPET
jgi:hypothetical protein